MSSQQAWGLGPQAEMTKASQSPVGRGETMSVQAPATFAEQLNAIASLNSRLTGVLSRVSNAVTAIHGAVPEPLNESGKGAGGAANGMGIVRTLAELTGRAHETVSEIEQQLERLDRAFG